MSEHCPSDVWLSNEAWLAAFSAKALRARVPVAGMLELTQRCNLQCVHCFNGRPSATSSARGQEMTTQEVKDLLDQLVEAGCLYLTLTGGDPMARPDFAEIYEYARARGLAVTILCNGTLITQEVLGVFDRAQPSAVEITLLGATASTHDRITRAPGSFERAWEGIRSLRQHRIRVALKTVLMTWNIEEVGEIRRKAEQAGCRYRVDALLVPRFSDGDRSPLALRVSPNMAVRCEMESEKARAAWRRVYSKNKALPPAERLYECGAARTCFFVDACGWVSPCLMLQHEKYDSSRHGFRAAWAAMANLLARRPAADFPCRTCRIRALCSTCPATNRLETGSETIPCDYACEIAKLRHRVLDSELAGVTL